MSKEVAKKASSAVSTELSQWGSGPDISTNDIVVPKLLLMQGTSDFVKQRKAQYGDLIDSIDHKVLGSPEKPFEVVPFFIKKYFTIRNKNTPKKDFMRVEALTPETDHMPYFDMDADGTEVIRERTYELYCVQAAEVSIGGLPLVIRLKASNEKTGKAVFTQMYIKNKNANLSPAAVAFEVSSREEAKEGNTYMVFDVKPKRVATKEEQDACLVWHKMTTKIKVDESDGEDVAKTEAPPKAARSVSDLKNQAPGMDLSEDIPF
jgi:hypothetical protein